MKVKNHQRKKFKQILSWILSICIFMGMFMGMDLNVQAASYSVWGPGTMSSSSVSVTMPGSWRCDIYTYTASNTGVYRFYSSNRSGVDPYIIVASGRSSGLESYIKNNGCRSTSYGFVCNDDGNGN